MERPGLLRQRFFRNPPIDRLAAEGVKFTDFYAAGAVCSPTRCAIQSGQNQARIGISAYIPGHWRPFERVITPQTTMALPLDTVTVAEALKQVGYATGYVGKWHLGVGEAFQPDRQGVRFFGGHGRGSFRRPLPLVRQCKSCSTARAIQNGVRSRLEHSVYPGTCGPALFAHGFSLRRPHTTWGNVGEGGEIPKKSSCDAAGIASSRLCSHGRALR